MYELGLKSTTVYQRVGEYENAEYFIKLILNDEYVKIF